MKIFITGGTGFIGKNLVNRLLKTDHELVCLARETSDVQHLKDAGVSIVTGDITDKTFLLQGMEGCDWVAHIAGNFVFWQPDSRIYRDVNVTGTRNVMECALEKGISKVVCVSTAAVFGNAKHPITEETPVGTKRESRYVRTKYEGELIAWDLYEKKKLPLVMVYPSAVVGPDDPKAAGRYIKNIAKGKMPAQALTNHYFAFVHVRDVAEVIARALEKENNIGEKYIVSAANYNWAEINQMISELSGTKLPSLKLPVWMVMLNAYFLTGIANLIKKPPLWDMSVDQMKLMKQGFKIDGSKVERELGMTYIPIKTAIKEAIESFQDEK